MVSNEEIKTIISVGDVADKYLVNSIKIEKINDERVSNLISNNEVLKKILREWSEEADATRIEFCMGELKKVLKIQWEYLDIVLDEEKDISDRMNHALLAQQLNTDRVYWKNKINELCGHDREVKRYGKE